MPATPSPNARYDRYDVRADDGGATVFDIWTGRAVVLETGRQSGLSYPDAYRLAETLNARSANGERSVLQ